jgi:hypothetical protein
MDMVNSHGNLEMSTRVIITRMKEMVMGKCTLQMELSIKVTGQEDFRLVDRS